MVSELLDPNQGIFAYTEHRKQAHPGHGGSSTEWFTEGESRPLPLGQSAKTRLLRKLFRAPALILALNMPNQGMFKPGRVRNRQIIFSPSG